MQDLNTVSSLSAIIQENKLLFLLLLAPLYIFIDSVVSLYQLKRINKEYCLWLHNPEAHNVAEKRSKFKSLIFHANIVDVRVPIAQAIGFFQVASASVSVLENFPSRHADIADGCFSLIDDAIGVYQARMWNAFNPLWWINTLIFLPRSVCAYLHIKADSLSVKMGQLLWWCFGVVLTAYKSLFPDNITRLVEEIYRTLLP